MARFVARIELHAATYDDYEALHGYMADEGFARHVRGDDGKIYQLPPAEYYGEGAVPLATALDGAKRAASRTGKRYAALVSEALALAWWDLPVVG